MVAADEVGAATRDDLMTADGTRRARRLRRLWFRPFEPHLLGRLLVLGYLLQVALRVGLSLGRDGPTIFADEIGYLANARVMSGGVDGQLGLASFYRGGYPLVLLPAYWLGDGPLSEYRLALTTNALLSSLVFPLVHVVLTRAFRVPRQTAAAAAFLAALYPPLVVNTQLAWAESLLPVLVLAAAISLAGVATDARPQAAAGWALACGASAGALYTTHGRTAPLVALLLVLLVGLALRRRDLAVSAAAGVAAAGAVLVAGQRLNEWLSARSWGPHHATDIQRVLDNARDLGSLENVAALGMGQSWYVFVATFGLVTLGLAHALARLSPRGLGTGHSASDEVGLDGPPGTRARTGDRLGGESSPLPGPQHGEACAQAGRSGGRPVARPDPPGSASTTVAQEVTPGGAWVVSAFLLGSAIGLAVLVGLFLRPPVRPDHVVYGRYVEVLVPPLLALGLVRLWTARLRRLAVELAAGAAVAVAACVTVVSYAGGLVGRGPGNWYNVLALLPLAQTGERIRPATATLVALAGAAVLLAVTRRSRVVGAIGLAGILVASSVMLRVLLIEPRDDAVHGAGPTLSAVEGLNSPQDVSYDLAAYTPDGLYGYQWRLDHARFVLFDSRRDPPPRTEWVIAGLDWPQATAVGARRVWVDPAHGQAAWRLP